MKENDLYTAAENFSLDKEEIYQAVINDRCRKSHHLTGIGKILIAAAIMVLMVTVCFAVSPALRQYLNLPFLKPASEGLSADHTGYIAVSTPEELDAVREDLSANYYLTNDITIPDSYYLEGGIFEGGFRPIYGEREMFSGIFDGDGHTIRNLKIDNTGGKFYECGLFAECGGMGAVYKLKIADSEITADLSCLSHAGFIAGRGNIIGGCSVENCVIRVTGGRSDGHTGYVGLLAGDSFLIDCCSADGEIICENGENLKTGLLAGRAGSAVTSLYTGTLKIGGTESKSPVGAAETAPMVIPESVMNELLSRCEDGNITKESPYAANPEKIKKKILAFYRGFNDGSEENCEQEKRVLAYLIDVSMFKADKNEKIYLFDPYSTVKEEGLIAQLLDCLYDRDTLLEELYKAGCKCGLMYCCTPDEGKASGYEEFDFDNIWIYGDDGIPQLKWFQK